jgi:hypothetical protein
MKRIRLTLCASAATLALVATGPATAATKLIATVGPGATITLKKAGKGVTSLPAGTYTITVQDKSGFHNFSLSGPGNQEVDRRQLRRHEDLDRDAAEGEVPLRVHAARVEHARQLRGQVVSGTLEIRPPAIVKAARSPVGAERIR